MTAILRLVKDGIVMAEWHLRPPNMEALTRLLDATRDNLDGDLSIKITLEITFTH